MTDTQNLVQLGFIRGAHGLRGHVVVHVFSGRKESLADYGLLYNVDKTQAFKFTVTGTKSGDFLCRIETVNDRDQAEALKGTRLYAPVAALPQPDEDEFYIKDLIGLTVLNASSQKLGTVVNVASLGAHDALEIRFEHDGATPLANPQTEFLLFTMQNVPKIAVAAGTITVDLPAGMFDTVERDT